MLKSVQLNLMMGQLSPQPVPRVVLDTLTEAEVQVEETGSSGFQLTFSVDKRSPLQISFLVNGGSQVLFMRVVLMVTINSVSTVLMDGVVTDNRYSPGDKGSNSTLTLTGKDLTALMDQSDSSGTPFHATKPEDRVKAILGKYAVFGIQAQVIPPSKSDAPAHSDRIPGQQGTDLQYIRSLAERVGHVFYLVPGPTPGNSKAYWGPQIRFGPVQPALSADMDAYTNVESLSFSVDQEKDRKSLVLTNSDKSGEAITISTQASPPLNPRLSRIPPKPPNTLADLIPFRDDLAKLPYGQALLLGLAANARNTEVVTCQGSLDVTRYGGILQSRQLVGVRGSSLPFDGLYYVKSVSHNIKRGEYKQKFTLTRDGLGSTVEKVAVAR